MTEVAFHTLEQQERFSNPSDKKSHYKLLHDAIDPHVQSFNAIFEGPEGGLIDLGIQEIGKKVIYVVDDKTSYDNIRSNNLLRKDVHLISSHISDEISGYDMVILDEPCLFSYEFWRGNSNILSSPAKLLVVGTTKKIHQ